MLALTPCVCKVETFVQWRAHVEHAAYWLDLVFAGSRPIDRDVRSSTGGVCYEFSRLTCREWKTESSNKKTCSPGKLPHQGNLYATT